MADTMGRAQRKGKAESNRLPIAARAIYPVAGKRPGFAGRRQDHALDKALDTPDLIAARAGATLDFRTDINGLRALAVIGVVAFHADRAWLPGGFVGVDIFFVISGFLISRIILAECAAGRFSLAMFYAKRAKRILPALLAVVSFVWIVGWCRTAPTQFRDIGGDLLGNSYFTVNFWLMRLAGVGGYFGADTAAKPLLHLWSLSIEEQFYLVWSVLLLTLFKLNERLVPVVILSIFAASFVFSIVLTQSDPIGAFYLPWTRAWELALGALIAYREVFWLEALPYPSRRIANIGAGFGVALMLCAFLFMNETQLFPGWLAAIPTCGCALVIAHPGSLLGRGRARQSRGRFLRRDFLSALSVALAAVRIRPHLARRDPDHARLGCPCGRSRVSRRAHLSADRIARGGGVSPPAVDDRIGSLNACSR